MPAARSLLMASGGLAIVVITFLVTSYALNWFASEPTLQPPTGPTSLAGPVQGNNLLWPSQDFGNAKWARYQIAEVDPAPEKAPNGENTASRLVESAENGRHFISNGIVGAVPGTVYTFSVYFKKGDRPIRLEMGDIPKGKYGTALCDVSMAGPSGSNWVKGGDVVAGAVEDAGDGWYRCWAAMPYMLSKAVLNIEMRDQNGVLPYQGDGHSGVVIWGAQFGPGARPAAYVATTTEPIAKAN